MKYKSKLDEIIVKTWLNNYLNLIKYLKGIGLNNIFEFYE